MPATRRLNSCVRSREKYLVVATAFLRETRHATRGELPLRADLVTCPRNLSPCVYRVSCKNPTKNNSKNRFQERRNVRYLLLRISIHWSFGSNWISLWWQVYNINLVYNISCILKGYLLSLLSLNFFRECLNFP